MQITYGFVGAKPDTVVGFASKTECDFVDKYGIPSIVLVDGPAGVRIDQSYDSFASLDANGKGVNPTKMYQFYTAWPVGILLAQTWDIDLIHQVGKASAVKC